MKHVIIVVSGGAVQGVSAPPGVRVIIRDYDVETEHAEGFDIRTDENGEAYQHMEFVQDGPGEGAEP